MRAVVDQHELVAPALDPRVHARRLAVADHDVVLRIAAEREASRWFAELDLARRRARRRTRCGRARAAARAPSARRPIPARAARRCRSSVCLPLIVSESRSRDADAQRQRQLGDGAATVVMICPPFASVRHPRGDVDGSRRRRRRLRRRSPGRNGSRRASTTVRRGRCAAARSAQLDVARSSRGVSADGNTVIISSPIVLTTRPPCSSQTSATIARQRSIVGERLGVAQRFVEPGAAADVGEEDGEIVVGPGSCHPRATGEASESIRERPRAANIRRAPGGRRGTCAARRRACSARRAGRCPRAFWHTSPRAAGSRAPYAASR